ncbi:MAG TPA: hypothetical protein VMB72_05140 [Acidimicrobiales bacterium]|nr:hypothetical protein [Acidimicrobiales bacterium]
MDERFEAAALAFGGVPFEAVGGGHRPLSVEEHGRVVGAYQWIERRLFEILGTWGASESVPEAQLVFDVYSAQHAWHAQLLGERLPVLDAIDPDTLAVPPSAEVDRMLGVLAGSLPLPADDDPDAGPAPGGGLVRAGGTLLRLVGMARVVLPRLVSGYSLHLRRLSAVSEAALARTLELVRRDEAEQWQTMEALTEALLRRPHDIAVVTTYQQRLEQLVAGSGVGLVGWPETASPWHPGPAPDDPAPDAPVHDGPVDDGPVDDGPVHDGPAAAPAPPPPGTTPVFATAVPAPGPAPTPPGGVPGTAPPGPFLPPPPGPETPPPAGPGPWVLPPPPGPA